MLWLPFPREQLGECSLSYSLSMDAFITRRLQGDLTPRERMLERKTNSIPTNISAIKLSFSPE